MGPPLCYIGLMRSHISVWREKAREKGLNFKGPSTGRLQYKPNPYAAAREHSKEQGWSEIHRESSLGTKTRRYEKGEQVGRDSYSSPSFAFKPPV